jgi:cytoskeletal protein CcmA (bactofilin family)
MWKKSETEDPHPQYQPPPPQPQPPTQTRVNAPQNKDRAMIGPTICIKGDLSGQEDLLIEGRVEGKVELRQHNVTVGKNGRVKADIYGKTITIEGEVQGNLFGEEQLVLRQTSTVRGNITAPRVSLEDGSNFKGSIDMSPKEASRGSELETRNRAPELPKNEPVPAGAGSKPDRGPTRP